MTVFTAEIYPTAIKNMGNRNCKAIGHIGASLIPLLVTPGEGVATMVVFGLLTLAGGFLVLLLPETFNKDLTNTIEEGEVFNNNFGGFNFCGNDKDSEKTAILYQPTRERGSA